MRAYWIAGAALLALGACSGGSDSGSVTTPTPTPGPTTAPAPTPTTSPSPRPIGQVHQTTVATLALPWAMVFLPDGRALVTEKVGSLRIVTQEGVKSEPLGGVPAVVAAGQGGLLDVALHPDFANNKLVYLTFAEAGDGGAGLAVARGTLIEDAAGARLGDTNVIWRQSPKVDGSGHFGGRMVFGPTGHLYVTAGERQKGAPAQDLTTSLGKIVRLNADGTIPADNPFVGTPGALGEIWSFGHRNAYGLLFDPLGRLWESEMGPEGGDELNIITRGGNYGWPKASYGQEYGGGDIPDHAPGDGFVPPSLWWERTVAPTGMIFYTGEMFESWKGDIFLVGLVSQRIVRVKQPGAAEIQRVELGFRARELEQAPDGALWVLEDANPGRMIRLTPWFD